MGGEGERVRDLNEDESTNDWTGKEQRDLVLECHTDFEK